MHRDGPGHYISPSFNCGSQDVEMHILPSHPYARLLVLQPLGGREPWNPCVIRNPTSVSRFGGISCLARSSTGPVITRARSSSYAQAKFAMCSRTMAPPSSCHIIAICWQMPVLFQLPLDRHCLYYQATAFYLSRSLARGPTGKGASPATCTAQSKHCIPFAKNPDAHCNICSARPLYSIKAAVACLSSLRPFVVLLFTFFRLPSFTHILKLRDSLAFTSRVQPRNQPLPSCSNQTLWL
jgi:hypothetical protein